MTAGAGAATYTGGSGNDTITGSGVADTLTGGAGSDTITGGGGADTLAGGAGNDTITGGAGGDTITGGAGVDTITAGAGADTVTGGAGADVIDITGTGAIDTLVMTAGNALNEAIGIDVITGFDTASVANLGDNIDIDLSDINNALNAGTLLTGDGTDAAASDTPVLTAITAGGYNLDGANSDILVLAGNYASTDEVETALEAGGAYVLTSDDAGGTYTNTTPSSFFTITTSTASFLASRLLLTLATTKNSQPAILPSPTSSKSTVLTTLLTSCLATSISSLDIYAFYIPPAQAGGFFCLRISHSSAIPTNCLLTPQDPFRYSCLAGSSGYIRCFI